MEQHMGQAMSMQAQWEQHSLQHALRQQQLYVQQSQARAVHKRVKPCTTCTPEIFFRHFTTSKIEKRHFELHW